MKYFNLFLILTIVSCQSHQTTSIQKHKSRRDITKYSGNALVFYNDEMTGQRLYIIQVDESDKTSKRKPSMGMIKTGGL